MSNTTALRFVVADYYVDIRKSLTELIECLGPYLVFWSDTADTALRSLSTVKPHVAVLDLSMFRYEDYAARLTTLRKSLPQSIFIVHTGWTSDADKAFAEQCCFDYYIVKGSDPEVLVQLINLAAMKFHAVLPSMD